MGEPPAVAGNPSLTLQMLEGKRSFRFPQLGGSAEDPGRLAPAGRYSPSENLYGALGPNGVLFQGSTVLLGSVKPAGAIRSPYSWHQPVQNSPCVVIVAR